MTIDRTDPQYQQLRKIMGADFASNAFGWPAPTPGRPVKWHDCPPELLNEYRRIARSRGSAVARARMEALGL